MAAEYTTLRAGGGTGLCRSDWVDALGTALGDATLYEWAASREDRRIFMGRAPAYAVEVPGRGAIVVRHSRHGGLLAPLTRDLFLPPTRAPRELDTALWLRAAGIRTPEIVAWLVYPAGPIFRRADVATRLVRDGRDLAHVLADPTASRGADAPWVRAAGTLMHALARAGARHPDLNLRNVLLAPDDAGVLTAWVLDVDVVRVAHRPDDEARRSIAAANLARLLRSLDKFHRLHGVSVRADERDALTALALAA